jgi:hypothetical protein
LYHIGCVIFGTRRKRKLKNMRKKKRASRLERGGGLEGFQTTVHFGGHVDRIYLAHDVQLFCATITLQCRELEPVFTVPLLRIPVAPTRSFHMQSGW